jgi:hypothetical protein
MVDGGWWMVDGGCCQDVGWWMVVGGWWTAGVVKMWVESSGKRTRDMSSSESGTSSTRCRFIHCVSLQRHKHSNSNVSELATLSEVDQGKREQ